MVKVFLVTANVGSVFENVEVGLEIWMREIISCVTSQNPQFAAIHFQETGGKDYKSGSNVINIFFRALVDNFAKVGLYLIEGFIDSDSEVESEFTALANVYFMRENLSGVQIWDYRDKEYVPVQVKDGSGRLNSGKELSSIRRKHKEKFPRHFFPNNVWSRKGYLRTRWNIQGNEIELINIHLFHDSSNLTASSASPSPFAQNRRKTLSYVLEKLQNEDTNILPRFIFGDFNFRVNTYEVFDILRKESISLSVENKDNFEAFEVEAKRFKVTNHEERFKHNFHWLRPYDFEASQFNSIVGEFDVNFHPTYPFDENLPDKFMRTRCPAWCDRVLFTQNAVDSISKEFPTEYNLIGGSVCMGDHKPVFLTFELITPLVESNDESSQPLMPNSLNSGISTPSASSTKLKCGFVSFLRESLHPHCTRSSRNRNTVSSNNKVNSASSSPTNQSRQGWKCCFRNNRNFSNNSTVIKFTESQHTSTTTANNMQNILISKDIESIDESKDLQPVKSLFILDGDSLKESSKCSAKQSNSISTDSRTQKVGTSRRKCCGCNII